MNTIKISFSLDNLRISREQLLDMLEGLDKYRLMAYVINPDNCIVALLEFKYSHEDLQDIVSFWQWLTNLLERDSISIEGGWFQGNIYHSRYMGERSPFNKEIFELFNPKLT